VKFIPTRPENGHQLDPDDIIKNIGMRTFAVVLNSPNNPTGAVYLRSTIEAIVEECAFRGIQVFSDEVYDHMILDDEEYSSVLSCGTDLDHLMCISSFSKTYSMAGLRVGWVISSQGAIKKLRRYHMFTTSVANTPAQFGGVAALEGDQQSVRDMIDIYRERRDLIVDLVNQTPHLTGYKAGRWLLHLPGSPGPCGRGRCLPPHAQGNRCLRGSRRCLRGTLHQLDPILLLHIGERIEEAFDRIIPWMKKQNF